MLALGKDRLNFARILLGNMKSLVARQRKLRRGKRYDRIRISRREYVTRAVTAKGAMIDSM